LSSAYTTNITDDTLLNLAKTVHNHCKTDVFAWRCKKQALLAKKVTVFHTFKQCLDI